MDFISFLEGNSTKKSTKSTALIIFGTVVGGLTVAITAISTPFIFPFFRRVCLPYVPATNQQVANVLEALKLRSGSLVDLGSGDGRIVIAAARQGFQSTGIEINPWLVVYSKISAFYAGLHKKAKFYKIDLWKYDLKPYDNVVIFGVDSMMDELEKKFLKELTSNTCIVACRFPLNNLTPVKTVGVGIDRVWVYNIRKRRIAPGKDGLRETNQPDLQKLPQEKNKARKKEKSERDRDNSRRPAPKRCPKKESRRSNLLEKAEVKTGGKWTEERKREHSRRVKEYWKRREEKEKNKNKKKGKNIVVLKDGRIDFLKKV